MIIDWHTHVHPLKEQARPFWQGRCPATIENVLRLHDEVGLDISIISSAAQYLRQLTLPDCHAALCDSNRYLASLRNAHPDRVVAFATTIPGGGDEFLRELERAVTEDGMKGVLISSSHRGAYPDDDAARPFFELVTRLDIPVMLHPPAIGFGEERMNEYRLASSVGRPFDSCLALARLIVRGVLEEFPTLKLVATHLGGGICEIIGRMDYAYTMADKAYFLGAYEPKLIRRKPSEYLKRVYFDTVAYHAPAVECAMKTVGADRLVFGTDSPVLLSLKRAGLDMIHEIEMGAADKARILGGTAKSLLKL